MAFVSDEYKLVFIHVPKTGGTSITEALTRAHGTEANLDHEQLAHSGIGNGIPRMFRPAGIDVHDPWFEIVRKCPRVREYQPIAVVRNPWARIHSFYWHKRRRRDIDLPKKPEGGHYSLSETFRVSNCCLLQPQIWWVPSHARIIQFDEIPATLDLIDRRLPSIDIPKLNRRPGWSASTDPNVEYRAAYDDYARSLIAAYYAFEITRYDYTF